MKSRSGAPGSLNTVLSPLERDYLRHLENTLAMYESAPKHWRKEYRAMQSSEYKKIMRLRKQRTMKIDCFNEDGSAY